MTKSTIVKMSIHHKKQKGPHNEKPWEATGQQHVSELQTHSKSRLGKHFPSRRWDKKHQEGHKGPKI